MKILIAALFLTQSVFAATETGQVEVLEAQASIQFHAKDYKKCLSILDKLLVDNPNNIAGLELAALAHRQLKNDDAAAKLYKRLLKIAPKEKRPAYHFDLAMIQYTKKDHEQAHKNFERALFSRFNPGMSAFYMGLMDFNGKKWRSARNNLSAALTYSDAKPLEPITQYYLATAYAQIGSQTQAIQHYREAEAVIDSNTKRGVAPDSNVTEIRKNILKELKGYDRGALSLNLSLMSQYDTNVQTNPVTATDPLTNSSRKSSKAIIGVGASASTSPTKVLQLNGSYNFYTNWNENHLARDFNFMSHTGTVIAMVNPGERFSFGVKNQLIFSLKNNLLAEQPRDDLRYRPYSTHYDLGPVAKYELTPRINLGAEVLYRPKWFYLDPASGDSRRTGGGVLSRVTAEFQSPFTWFNPMAYVTYEWDHPRGRTFRVYQLGGGVSNALYLTDKFTLTPSMDILGSDYYAIEVPKRDDTFMNYKIAGMYSLTPKWTAMADIAFMNNNSTIAASYSYTRFTGSLGASYVF